MERFWCLAVAISWVLFACTVQAQQPRLPPARPVARPLPAERNPGHTATIDLQRILAESKLFQKRLAETHTANDERHAHLKRLRTEANDAHNVALQYVPGSPEHARRTLLAISLQGELATKEQAAQYECDRAEVVLYAEFYRLVEGTVRDYAARNNISLVLNRRTPARFAPEVTEAKQLFEQRTVFESDLDITDEILARLDEPTVRLQVPKPMSE
jgi:Skp family chaperone for outer membrane proteins